MADTMQPQRSLKRTLISFAIATLLGLSVFAIGSASRAEAHTFCAQWLAPFGQAGDRCASGVAQWGAVTVVGSGQQHSMCVNAYDQYNNLHGSWVCSSGPGVAQGALYQNSFLSARGVARNNAGGSNWVRACQNAC
jgi:hypothetical protein